jgi:hypothetical protein
MKSKKCAVTILADGNVLSTALPADTFGEHSFVVAHDGALKHDQLLSEIGRVTEAGCRRADVLLFPKNAFGEQSQETCEAQYQLALSQYDMGQVDEAVLAFSTHRCGIRNSCDSLKLRNHGAGQH